MSILSSCLYSAPQKRMILLTHFWVSPSCWSQGPAFIQSLYSLQWTILWVFVDLLFLFHKTEVKLKELNASE